MIRRWLRTGAWILTGMIVLFVALVLLTIVRGGK
jgi:hypothetical protein